MIAPSPDWSVQIKNTNLLDTQRGGVDDGREFTDLPDPSFDIPTVPPVEDDTERFECHVVSRCTIRRV